MNKIWQKTTLFGAVFALVLALVPVPTFAAAVTARSVTIGSSVASATTTYSFNFHVPSATILKSVAFNACTTASGGCTAPAGFSASTSTLTSQPANLGASSGWVVDTTTPGSLRLNNSTDAVAPTGNQTVGFSGVVNPSTTNATFFIQMTTYSDAAYGTPVDTGVVATSTAGAVTVTASVDEALSFTLGTQTVALGTLTNAITRTGTSVMTASTNATSGYNVTVNGSTLAAGATQIAALTTPTTSSVNTQQFGINLKANTTPAIGTEVSGTGSGVAAAGYGTANSFKFVTGDTVASATTPTNSNAFTVSYIANITGSTAPGAYQTILNYVATANF